MNHETHEYHEKVLFREEGFAIQGALFEVYREMGSGFLETVYQECLAIEFRRREIPFEAQKDLSLVYKGERLQQIYRPDFVCFGKIVVELKAAKELAPEHRAQVLNYLKTTGLRLGLLVNFGHYPKAQMERLVL
ncbi:MAG: GxxExxY protein [Gemmatimonas sp.]|nr:GxxExxY protein [Gemmatimonas sp.]